MATATKTAKPKSKSSGPRKSASASASESRNGAGSKTSAKAARSTSSKAKPAGRKNGSNGGAPKSRAKTSVPKRRQAQEDGPLEKADALKDEVVAKAKEGGRSVGEVASSAKDAAAQAKAPLLAGGAALAGLAGGVLLNGRRKKGPMLSLPGGKAKLDLGKLSLESATSAGRRVGALGQQIGDVAAAVEGARKKS